MVEGNESWLPAHPHLQPGTLTYTEICWPSFSRHGNLWRKGRTDSLVWHLPPDMNCFQLISPRCIMVGSGPDLCGLSQRAFTKLFVLYTCINREHAHYWGLHCIADAVASCLGEVNSWLWGCTWPVTLLWVPLVSLGREWACFRLVLKECFQHLLSFWEMIWFSFLFS